MSDLYIFQIIGGKYVKIPDSVSKIWKNKLPNYNYTILNDKNSTSFLSKNFNKEIVSAFYPGDSKWKADLLRFCLLYKYAGIYCDVDTIPHNLNLLPNDIDTIMCIGAHSPPKHGLSPLPKGEIHIGFIKCNTPDPLFLNYINWMTPKRIATGEPYAINIQGLYIFLCKRLSVNEIKPFTTYIDPVTKRSYYFIREIFVNNKYKMIDKDNNIIIHSQELPHETFMDDSTIKLNLKNMNNMNNMKNMKNMNNIISNKK